MADIYLREFLEDYHYQRHVPQPLRDRTNPLDVLTDEEMLARYRFTRRGVMHICDVVDNPNLHRVTNRSNALLPIHQVCAALRFYACGSFQQVLGDTLQLSQPSVSRCVKNITNALVEKCNEYIYLPTDDEIPMIKQKFNRVQNFPNVIGLVDGTLIKITAPSEHEDVYVNRKHFHSLNTQLMVDSDCVIRNVVSWPGSTHDSRMIQNSGLWNLYEGAAPGAILGDSGYPCRRWLLTPFPHPNNPAQERYNRAHKITRSVVERAIGQFKRRFNCLHQELRFEPEKCTRVVIACAVLYNIRKRMGLPEEDNDDVDVDDDNDDGDVRLAGAADDANGQTWRLCYANNYFN